MEIDSRILTFIRKHHVMGLATVSHDQPWCCQCFYAWLDEENLLVFTSDEKTRHVREANENPKAAVSIALETRIVGRIQGVQMNGKLFKPQGELLEKTRKRYLRRFPYAVVMLAEIWCFDPEYIKMTDNTLGFGKKLIWEKSNTQRQ